MKLKYVTLTGADSSVQPEELVALSKKYPFVEWAILFSQSKSGTTPRYPGHDWVLDLLKIAESTPMNLSAHLCGKWVDDALKGEITFLKDAEMNKAFRRVQLNMGKDRLQGAFKNKQLVYAIIAAEKQVIFGGNYAAIIANGQFFDTTGTYPLFDASGGRGIAATEWPKPLTYTEYAVVDGQQDEQKTVFCGYAGGLGPDNILAELKRIEEVVGDATIWVDMESRVRTKDKAGDRFDLAKCEQVLQVAQPWVG
jgi:hypothetical protein